MPSFWVWLSLVPAAAMVLSGCSSGEPDTSGIVATAEQFGGIRLPADVEVLGARADTGGPDDSYRLSVKTTPEGADQLVEDSGLAGGRPEEPGFVIYTQDIVAGPELVAGSGVLSWQDRITNGDGRLVSRNITVDERQSPEVYVHLLVFDVS
ncbi:hypothetical protein [Mycobacterium sp. SMC-4]|uniref:hypothetical protein n=1 Tax=Mycobacterium sp. SMC-4 TaxID=2857059 RepID=UPI003D06500D